MPDALASALAAPGLGWIAFATFVAGAVYGFAGFGAALVFMPVALIWLTPAQAVGAIAVCAASSALTVLPGALRRCRPAAVGPMLLAAAVVMPFGVLVLRRADPEALRTAVAVIVLATLAALMAGWRMRTAPNAWTRAAVGAGAGGMGAATGLNGPVVILFNLAGSDPADAVRADTIVFLTLTSLYLIPLLILQGALGPQGAWIGALLFPIYGLGSLVGRASFRPGQEALYRRIAYVLIGFAGLAGLPVW